MGDIRKRATALLVVLAVLGMGLNLAMSYGERKLVPWLEKYRPS